MQAVSPLSVGVVQVVTVKEEKRIDTPVAVTAMQQNTRHIPLCSTDPIWLDPCGLVYCLEDNWLMELSSTPFYLQCFNPEPSSSEIQFSTFRFQFPHKRHAGVVGLFLKMP